MVTVDVSWDVEFFKSAQLYLGDGLEMAGYILVTVKNEIAHSLLRFPRK